MAYHDENGKITIDEEAAREDIKRLRNAANMLDDSMKAIQKMRISITKSTYEVYKHSLEDKNTQMYNRLKDARDELNATADYIDKVVKEYQHKDKLIRDAIKAASIGIGVATGGIAGGIVGAVTGSAIADGLTKK